MKVTSLPYELVDFREGRFVEEWIAFAKEVRLDGLELLIDSGAEPGQIDRLRALVAKSGLEVSMLTSNQALVWPIWSWKRLRTSADETVERIRADIVLAKSFGTKLLRLRPAPGWDESQREVSYACVLDRAVEVASRAAEIAREEDVILVLENHPLDVSVKKSFFDDLFVRVDAPQVGINLDVENASRLDGQGVWDFLEDPLIRPRIGYVHVRNFRATPDGWREYGLADGDLDVAAILRELRTSGYDGWLSFEYSGDALDVIAASVQYIREAWGG